jgi:hypothetical protein
VQSGAVFVRQFGHDRYRIPIGRWDDLEDLIALFEKPDGTKVER